MANKLISELASLATVENADLMEVQDIANTGNTQKATVEAVTRVERLARIAQDDTIEASVGLTTGGAYDTPSGTNYLDSTTSVMNALETLDAAIVLQDVRTTVVDVSAANLNNAGIAPFTIIGAQGASSWIEVISCSIWLNYVSAAVECGTQKLVLEYSGAANHIMEWSNTFIEGGADDIAYGTWTSTVDISDNTALVLTFDGGVNPTAGNSALKVAITYVVHSFAAS